MISALLVSVLVSQTYSRSRQVELDTASQCLWWKENTKIVYRINSDGNAETPGDTEFTAIQNAFSTWQTELASCSSLTLEQGPRTSSRLATYDSTIDPPPQNENIVLFRQKRCAGTAPNGDACWSDGSCGSKYDCWQYTEGAIAITTTSFSPRNAQVFDSDIELNTPSFIFTTVDSPPCVRGSETVNCVATDVQNTMTHEVGHLLGLAHINDAASTMNPRAVTGELTKRLLDPGSKKFVCDVYPKGQASKTCFTPKLGVETAKVAKTGCSEVPALSMVALGAWLSRRRKR